MTKKLVTLLILIVGFNIFKANAGVLTVPIKDLAFETKTQTGQLKLRDKKTRKTIFVGSHFSKEHLMAIYHKYALGRSIQALGVRNPDEVKFVVDEEKLNSATPHLGFKVKTTTNDQGAIEIPANQINPWIRRNGDHGMGTIKIDREVIFSRPIHGDAEQDDFLDFVNGVNAQRGSGRSTIKFDINHFNQDPENYWELIQGLKTN